jgi:elongation factor Ts
MAPVSAAMVKDLREKTGAGMMDCKNALNETAGDLEAAVDWLRKKGITKAAKKADRVAAEGLVAALVEGAKGVVVEVNSETDFVARNADFQALVRDVAAVALERGGDAEAVLAAPAAKGGTVRDAISGAIATIGENMTLRRVAHLAVDEGVIGRYVHGSVGEGLGKIAVIVALESAGKAEELHALGRQLAMHVAATNPLGLDPASIDPAAVEREKAVLADKNAGKPAAILAKIVDSGLKSYFKEVSLLDQSYIHDTSKTVAQAVKEAEKAVGAPVALKGFARFALGDGIARPEGPDFAAEVASISKG